MSTVEEANTLTEFLTRKGHAVKEGTPVHVLRKMAAKQGYTEETKVETMAINYDELMKSVPHTITKVKNTSRVVPDHKYNVIFNKSGRQRKCALMEEPTSKILYELYKKS